MLLRVTKKDSFFSTVLGFIEGLNFRDEPVLLTGDFNCTLDPKFDRSPRKEHHPSSPKVLTEIIQRFELSDVYRHINPTLKVFTWRNKSCSASRIDRIYISDFMLTRIKIFFY